MCDVDDFNEFEILNCCALRFDAYKYAKAHGGGDNDYALLARQYLATGILPLTREDQLCAFFFMQRSFNWGGSDRLTKDSLFWQRYRELFLTVSAYKISAAYRLHDWWERWEARYRPHLAEYVARIRDIHAATVYLPDNKADSEDEAHATGDEVDDGQTDS